jgi:hypothetical protein
VDPHTHPRAVAEGRAAIKGRAGSGPTCPERLQFRSGYATKATRTQSMKTPNLMRLRMRPFVRAERVVPTSSGEPLAAAHDLD